jgi:FkbM family methyltransferase
VIKKLLKKTLTPGQYGKLAALKRRLAGDDLITQVRAAVVHRSLSPASLLDLKNEINVVEQMDYERRPVLLSVDSRIEYETRLHSCKKEPDTVNWIETFLKGGDVLFDVGANVGAYSLVAAKFFDNGVKVYAFEPAFLNYTQLCKNVHLNGCQGSVVPLPVALSDKTALGVFNYHNLIPGGALHTFGAAVDHKGEAFEPAFTQHMLSYRLDDLIGQFDIPVPNHIKIDVDGIEMDVLEGARETLSNPALRSVIVELEAGEGERRITELLTSKGFELHSKYSRWTPGMLNCIFSRTGI